MVVILGVTAALVAETPAKAQQAVAAGPVSRDARSGRSTSTLVVDPARTGQERIHIYLLDHSTGQPAEVDEIRVAASLPAAGSGLSLPDDTGRARARSRVQRRRCPSRASGGSTWTSAGASSTSGAPLSTIPIRKD